MSKESVFLLLPEDFKNKFLIFPPKVKEVVGNTHFPEYRHILTISQEDLEDVFVKADKNKDISKVPTPLEYLLINSYNDKNFEELAKQAFYFFIKQEVTFIYDNKSILIGNIEEEVKRVKSLNELVFLTEEDYFDFQNKIREALGEKPIEIPDKNLHPKIRRMKALARYRDKIKSKQKGLDFFSCLVSICCMGIGLTPLNIGELSYAAVSELMAKYQDKEKFEIDIASLHAGANPKKVQPKYWIKNNE